jgi:hypothetical protein
VPSGLVELPADGAGPLLKEPDAPLLLRPGIRQCLDKAGDREVRRSRSEGESQAFPLKSRWLCDI